MSSNMERVEEIIIIRRTVPVKAQPSTGALVNAVLGKMRTVEEKRGSAVAHLGRVHLQQMDAAAKARRRPHVSAAPRRAERLRTKHKAGVKRIAHGTRVHPHKRRDAAHVRFHHSAVPVQVPALPFAVRPTVPLTPIHGPHLAPLHTQTAAHRALHRDAAAKVKRRHQLIADSAPQRPALPAVPVQPRGHLARAGHRVRIHGHGGKPRAHVVR